MSIEEINKRWSDHLHSLRMWGGEFDEKGVKALWGQELIEFLDSEATG